MRAYVVTTGVIFGLLVLAHAWRVAGESPELLKDPFFVAATLVAAALCAWAFRLARAPRAPGASPAPRS
jgi:hypothetical protein